MSKTGSSGFTVRLSSIHLDSAKPDFCGTSFILDFVENLCRRPDPMVLPYA